LPAEAHDSELMKKALPGLSGPVPRTSSAVPGAAAALDLERLTSGGLTRGFYMNFALPWG
jgi:hypothetical protein